MSWSLEPGRSARGPHRTLRSTSRGWRFSTRTAQRTRAPSPDSRLLPRRLCSTAPSIERGPRGVGGSMANRGGTYMNANQPASAARKALGDFAPKLGELTDKVLFGDVWERAQLSKRDRSLITCAALVAMGKTEQMNFHFPRAIENGVTRDDLVELITHLAFYAGWPSAMSAMA